MFFRQIFDRKLAQYAYVIGCQATGEAIVIDPMRDVDGYLDVAREKASSWSRSPRRTSTRTSSRARANWPSAPGCWCMCRARAGRTGSPSGA